MIMLWMFAALTLAYRARGRAWACAGWFLLCLAGGMGSILVQEKLFPNFLVYMLLFVLWGCVFGAAALRGQNLWKCAMAAEYGCIVFHLGKAAALVSSWLPPEWQRVQWIGFALMQAFALPSAWFLSHRAVTTARKVPAVCWASLFGVSVIGIGLAYYQMSVNQGAENRVSAALTSIGVIAMVLVVSNLCAQLIRGSEQNLVRFSLQQGSDGTAAMARQAGRMVEALRRYRHETVNHLTTLSALLSQGEIEKAQALLGEMTATAVPAEDGIYSGNALVDALLSQKKAACRDTHIDFSADVVLTEQLPLNDAELSSLLGNLLNNAIEAASGCAEPFVRTRMYPARDYLCIEVINSADTARLRENPVLHTTKQDPELHGIGLQVVQEIVQRHNGMADLIPGDDCFTARIMIRL